MHHLDGASVGEVVVALGAGDVPEDALGLLPVAPGTQVTREKPKYRVNPWFSYNSMPNLTIKKSRIFCVIHVLSSTSKP